jgi:hypothetical protein
MIYHNTPFLIIQESPACTNAMVALKSIVVPASKPKLLFFLKILENKMPLLQRQKK